MIKINQVMKELIGRELSPSELTTPMVVWLDGVCTAWVVAVSETAVILRVGVARQIMTLDRNGDKLSDSNGEVHLYEYRG